MARIQARSTSSNATLPGFQTTGQCFPSFFLFGLAMNFYSHTTDFVNFAVSNSHVDQITLLYFVALAELRLLLMRTNGQGDSEVPRRLVYTDLLLANLAEGSDRYKARFFGFAIGFGMLRTLAVTLFALGIGLWSILRGAGVGVT